MSTIAIIPARGGSKRVPGKNRRDFLGLPLIAWSIRFASAIRRFDRIVVSTDSEEIAQIARAEGVDVPELRPPDLSTDTATSVSVALHVLGREAHAGRQYDTLALLQPTSPVRLKERWDTAFALLGNPANDSVVGVAPVRNHPYHAHALVEGSRLSPFIAGGDDLYKMRSQDLPSAYCLAGNLYLTRTSVLEALGTFYPPRTSAVICDQPFEAMDIDTEADWVMAEALTKFYGQRPCQHL